MTAAMSNEQALSPCPFCGETDIRSQESSFPGIVRPQLYCANCRAGADRDVWNRRARPSPARDKVLEEAALVADHMAERARMAGEAEAVSEVDERYRERVDAAVVAELAYEAIATGIRALKAQPVDCVSCGGLNVSCPDGCGRDAITGELNGTRLEQPPSTVGEDANGDDRHENRDISTELLEAANLLDASGDFDLRDACRDAAKMLAPKPTQPAIPIGQREELVDRRVLQFKLDEVIDAVRREWGIGSTEHNLVRDISDALCRLPLALSATPASVGEVG